MKPLFFEKMNKINTFLDRQSLKIKKDTIWQLQE